MGGGVVITIRKQESDHAPRSPRSISSHPTKTSIDWSHTRTHSNSARSINRASLVLALSTLVCMIFVSWEQDGPW